jgi:hypothetical protein
LALRAATVATARLGDDPFPLASTADSLDYSRNLITANNPVIGGIVGQLGDGFA